LRTCQKLHKINKETGTREEGFRSSDDKERKEGRKEGRKAQGAQQSL